MQVLTQSGTPNSWRSSMCVESIINTVLLNMCAFLLPILFPACLRQKLDFGEQRESCRNYTLD